MKTKDDARDVLTEKEQQEVRAGQERNSRDFQHWLDWVQGKRPDPPVAPF